MAFRTNHQPHKTRVTAAITIPLRNRKAILCFTGSSLHRRTVRQKNRKLHKIQP